MIHSTFTAELHCQYGRVGVVETPLWVYPPLSLNVDGWLCTEDHFNTTASFKPVRFEFAFLEQVGERTYYKIKCDTSWEYEDAKLAQNGNGWLGLYGTHVFGRIFDLPKGLFSPSRNKWKVETLQAWDGEVESAEHIDFYLRDSAGHRVSLVSYIYERGKPQLHLWFLNAGEMKGEILVFQLRDIELKPY